MLPFCYPKLFSNSIRMQTSDIALAPITMRKEEYADTWCIAIGSARPTRCHIMAQEWHFWRNAKKISHVGHAGMSEGPPFFSQDDRAGVMVRNADSGAASVINRTRPELSKR
jgi:hypothetical protein